MPNNADRSWLTHPRVGVVTRPGTYLSVRFWLDHRADCPACRLRAPCLVGDELRETAAAKGAALYQDDLRRGRAR